MELDADAQVYFESLLGPDRAEFLAQIARMAEARLRAAPRKLMPVAVKAALAEMASGVKRRYHP